MPRPEAHRVNRPELGEPASRQTTVTIKAAVYVFDPAGARPVLVAMRGVTVTAMISRSALRAMICCVDVAGQDSAPTRVIRR